jgi:hypothetical protein
MNDFGRYLELIVDPTFKEYQLNPRSVRHAFIACVVIYHAIDRAARGEKSVGNLRKDWRNDSFPFKYVDIALTTSSTSKATTRSREGSDQEFRSATSSDLVSPETTLNCTMHIL